MQLTTVCVYPRIPYPVGKDTDVPFHKPKRHCAVSDTAIALKTTHTHQRHCTLSDTAIVLKQHTHCTLSDTAIAPTTSNLHYYCVEMHTTHTYFGCTAFVHCFYMACVNLDSFGKLTHSSPQRHTPSWSFRVFGPLPQF